MHYIFLMFDLRVLTAKTWNNYLICGFCKEIHTFILLCVKTYQIIIIK